MKQLALAFLLSFSAVVLAQQVPHQRLISVNGIAESKSPTLTYKTDVTLTMDNNYYGEGPYNTLAELKTKYYETLTDLGIDTSKFVEDPLAYAATGYRKEGIVLRFETKDEAEILKVTGVRMIQVLPSYVQVKSEISEAQLEHLMTLALEDARKNADLLASTMDVKIKDIHTVVTNYDRSTYWMSPSSDLDYIRVTVSYTLK